MPRILVVAPSWIGDAVLTQPLLQRLHQRHSNLILDVLAPPWTQPLFACMPEVQDTIASPFGHGEFALKRRYELARHIAARDYERAIVLPNSFKSALIPYLAGIRVRTGFLGEARWGLLNDARRLDKRALPLMVERFAVLAEDTGNPLTRPLATPSLKIDAARRSATLARLGLAVAQRVAVLCPGAEYGPAKRWPARYFAELAQKLATARYEVWLVGSQKDAVIGDEITRHSENACINLCGTTSLAEAIDLLSCATLVVSNDSGLMHVAAALDRRLIAIFGSSSPAFTPPLSVGAQVLKLDLPCSPCFKRVCPLGHFNCMMQLSVAQVWERIEFGKM